MLWDRSRMFSALTQVFFVLLPKPSSPFSQGHSNPRDGSPILPALEDRTHLPLLNGREVARMCPSLPGTAGSAGTIPETPGNPLLPGCQKGEVLFLLGCGCIQAGRNPHKRLHLKCSAKGPEFTPSLSPHLAAWIPPGDLGTRARQCLPH